MEWWQLILLGMFVSIIVARIVSLITKSKFAESVLTGAVITLIETYFFFIQDNVDFLPKIPPAFQFFIAGFILGRIILLALKVVPQTRGIGMLLGG